MTPAPTFYEASVAIFGPGLLGGSLALALRERCPSANIRVWARREEAAEKVRLLGVADFVSCNVSAVAQEASLIILATPVETMPSLARQIAASELSPEVLVTDVGSVKSNVVDALEPIFEGRASFVGSHPMAGSEKAGIDEARADLFHGAACIVTPRAATPVTIVERLRAFWDCLGCRVLVRDPATHDCEVARISHLPHMMAAVTTRAGLAGHAGAIDCIGNGFRDSTRVAAGDPGLWAGIVAGNRAEILAALKDAQAQLGQLVEIIANLDDEALRDFLAQAKALRDAVPAATVSPPWPQSK
ncbi:MAG: prephenate dehydrogenase/arogenate dehydrogenase family protein [Verrucomicrobiales bacterium]|nr:prephenate dehydrogenase/arogenate dehydrogenase family protein [Verrucomicrobiales bacterium]MCP5556314.1 prephenate dehydrogenase/arogenate dehydrogenase family protein [Verrucomicrobiaceae bacterium]